MLHAHTDPGGIDEVLADFLESCDPASAGARAELLPRHPEFAAELQEFFADLDRFHRFTAPLRRSTLRSPADNVLPVFPSGQTLGDYKLLKIVGEGGMGVVYQARQISLNRAVAVKMIRAGRLAAPDQVGRFRNETEAAARLDHAGVVPIYEVGEAAGHLFYSMKLIEGGNLLQHLLRFTADPRAAARLVVQVARAVHHAHQRGVLHRDLKPSNILLDLEGRPHVSDFGLAKWIESDSSFTQSGALVGTPSYMAPELAATDTRGCRGATVATDVYGVGAILYALLTGGPPFRGATVLETLEQVRGNDPRPVRAANPLVDRDLEAVCLKCLEKAPNRRYRSAEDVALDLEQWLFGAPVQARPLTPWVRFRRWGRRNRVAAAVVLTLGLTTTLAAWGWWRSERLYRAEVEQRRRAEAHKQLVFRAVNDMYTRVAEFWLAAEPGMTELQREFLAKALAIYQELADEDSPDPKLRHQTAIAYFRMGNILHKLGQTEGAEASYRHALGLFQQLAEEFPAEQRYRYDVFYLNMVLGELVGRRSPDEEAKLFAKAMTLIEQLVAAYPDDHRYRDALANHSMNVAGNAFKNGDLEAAEKVLRTNLAAVELLIRNCPEEKRYRRQRSRSLAGLARVLRNAGRLTDAEQAFRQALESAQEVAEEFKDVPEGLTYRQEVAEYRQALASVLIQTGRFADAEQMQAQALATWEKLVHDFPGVPGYADNLALVHHDRGHLRWAAGRATEAEEDFRYFRTAMEDRARRFPTEVNCRLYLARLLAICPDPALRDPERAVDWARQAIALAPQDYANWMVLGAACYQTGDWQGCVTALDQVPELAGRPVPFACFFQAMALWQLNDRDRARRCYDRGVQEMEKSWRGDPDTQRFRAEAETVLKILAAPK